MLFYLHVHIFLIQLLHDQDHVEAKDMILNYDYKNIYLLVLLVYLCIYQVHLVELQYHFDVLYFHQAKKFDVLFENCYSYINTLFCALRNLTSYLSVLRFSSLIRSSTSLSEFLMQEKLLRYKLRF
jgi:hypothetical protein